MGLMAGVGGLMQVNLAQEVVPNALIGRELDVLAAVVLGGARLGGGRGSVLGCFLGVMLVAVVQNGLNLLGVSPYAFKMVIGLTILAAISLSNVDLAALLAGGRGGAVMSVTERAACRSRPRLFGREVPGLLGLLALTVVAFGLTSPQFLTAANFDSIAFQLPDLGLLTLAMLAPIMSGGINLAIIATANLSGLTLAWILNMNGGPQAGFTFCIKSLARKIETCRDAQQLAFESD